MTPSIEPYNPLWKSEFGQLRQVLETRLAGIRVDIQHVGSTSIPGVFAKPVIDLDIIVEDTSLLPEITYRLEKAGYISRGDQGVPGRFAFRQSAASTPRTAGKPVWMKHHLYVCFSDSLALKNHLLFRDALLADPVLVERYSTLKRSLLTRPDMTKEQYSKLKTDFVLEVLERAGLDQAALDDIRTANQ